ncbi:MAG: hypothetical protein IJM30_10700 [Thermoguttaceae bacterium]|nr:hypothetical protein [Thermoguttaceae bacterium]
MTTRNATFALLAFALTTTCALGQLGCSRSGESAPPDESPSAKVERDAEETPATEPEEDGAPNKSGGTGFDAAGVLGRATEKFEKTFSDDDPDSPEANGSDVIDVSLVDEETRRKYVDDRTLVTPTLDSSSRQEGTEKYKLEYKFPANANLSWTVVHTVNKRVSYGGKETLTQTSSTTRRRWELLDAKEDGKTSARHWIDRMILEQREEGKDPISYDSERDVVVPKEISAFGTEKAVGVALETFDVDPLGVMSDKTKLVAEYQGREGDSNVVVPFPKEEVGVGDVWVVPYSIYLKGADKVTRPYRAIERFRLDNINEKYASISFKTTLMSIVDDPVVEGELAERLFTGKTLFDRELGLTTRTEMTFDKKVTGAFGFSSFLEYSCRVVEKLDRGEQSSPEGQTPEQTSEETLSE